MTVHHMSRTLLPLSAMGALLLACSAGSSEADDGIIVNPNEPPPEGSGEDPGGAAGSGAVVNMEPGLDFGVGAVSCNGAACAFPAEALFDESGQTITSNEVAPFADPESFVAGSLCVMEPHLGAEGQAGALFPRNWLRPRFRWTTSGNEAVWEIRLSHPSEPEDLVAYTRDTQWLLPASIWERMGALSEPVTVTIRGVGADGGQPVGYRGTFSVAPVDAGGSMVFWSTDSSYVSLDSSKLQGFSVGDEGVSRTLVASQVETTDIIGEDGAAPRGMYPFIEQEIPYYETQGGAPVRTDMTPPGSVECIGCHVSTPDGEAVVFTDNWPWNKVVASIEGDTRGAIPDYMTETAVSVLKQPWLGMQALSPAHFEPGDRTLLTSYAVRAATQLREDPGTQMPFEVFDAELGQQPQLARHVLAWFDLEAGAELTVPTSLPPFDEADPNSANYYGLQDLSERRSGMSDAYDNVFGFVETTGETANAVTPSWSHDGETIAYVSTDVASTDGHPDYTATTADIMLVPYNNRAGGTVEPLSGASDPGALEYYPEFSSDDAFIAFTRAPAPSPQSPDGPYYNRNGEIHIVPAQGAPQSIRLAANDPVACSGETAAGSINSWPKWSPRVETANGLTYYFLIFSSARGYPGAFEIPPRPDTPPILNKSSQLYMAAVTVDAQGTVQSYPAVYLWNQDINIDANGNAELVPSSNLTPAWDDFSIPEVPPPITIPR